MTYLGQIEDWYHENKRAVRAEKMAARLRAALFLIFALLAIAAFCIGALWGAR